MANDPQSAANAFADRADVFLMPGRFLASLFGSAGTEASSAAISGLSLVCWILAFLLLTLVLRIVVNILVSRLAFLGIGVKRFVENLASRLRIGILARLNRLDWRRNRMGSVQEEIELDELEIAVLEHGAKLPAGQSIAVVDVAESLGERPTRVQKCLDMLRHHQMVEPLMGSTDGYGDYGLTVLGRGYIAAHRRDEPAPVPAG